MTHKMLVLVALLISPVWVYAEAPKNPWPICGNWTYKIDPSLIYLPTDLSLDRAQKALNDLSRRTGPATIGDDASARWEDLNILQGFVLRSRVENEAVDSQNREREVRDFCRWITTTGQDA